MKSSNIGNKQNKALIPSLIYLIKTLDILCPANRRCDEATAPPSIVVVELNAVVLVKLAGT